ncbi:MAG TPA: glycosyltransferase family 4 protein [Vicinamibacteria bacterium]|nr:glycosyltransferase family 4 protein [Vicinamibacteria bacterium]
MTRVLFLAESFHPVLGGGETQLRRLGGALVAAGDAATVVTRRGEPSFPASDEVDGIRVRRVPPAGPSRRGKYLMVPAALGAVAAEARGHDLLVVRGTRVLGLPGLVAGRLAGLPVIQQPEINGELDGEVFTWGKPWAGSAAGRAVRDLVALRNLWLRDAEGFVAMSARIREEMIGAGIAPERVALIPHAVDTGRFRPASPVEARALRLALGLPSAGLLVAYTGRLLRGKGLEVLLDAFTLLASQDPGAHLVLVGSGEGQLSVEDELRRRSGEEGLAGRVTFAGRVERVEDWLRAADVFAFPSVFEALGISLIEALACGLPSVASRTGGIVDIVEDGRSGLLVPPGDAAALAATLRALAGDPARRAAMAQAARARAVERFDHADNLARYRALFAEVAARGRRRSRRR